MTNLERAIIDEYKARIISDGVMACDRPVDAVFFLVDYVKEINASTYGLEVNEPRVVDTLTAEVVEAIADTIKARA